jgi:hypothetical protein
VLEVSVNEDPNSDDASPGNSSLSKSSCSTHLATLACETAAEGCQVPVTIGTCHDVRRGIPYDLPGIPEY